MRSRSIFCVRCFWRYGEVVMGAKSRQFLREAWQRIMEAPSFDLKNPGASGSADAPRGRSCSLSHEVAQASRLLRQKQQARMPALQNSGF